MRLVIPNSNGRIPVEPEFISMIRVLIHKVLAFVVVEFYIFTVDTNAIFTLYRINLVRE